MAVPLSLGPVHHLRLTVTNVERSKAFYTELLGFQIAMDTPPPADDPHHDLSPTCSRTASSWSTATCSWGCVR
jgi:catechol 2,3-dioxygenase-like lactoylglutathione lyase family enzyme